jgi:hypothetical protein
MSNELTITPAIRTEDDGTRLVLGRSGVVQFGLPRTQALLFGSGASADRSTTATASKNFVGFWTESTATSGDSRGLYWRHYFAGAGGSGEALRAYATIDGVTVATGGTVNGAHISLDAVGAGAKVSGAAHAVRLTFGIAAAATALGGTCAVAKVETDIKTGATVPPKMAYLRFEDSGDTGLDYLFATATLSTALVANAGTGANSAAVSTGGVAAKALKVNIGGTDYWIGLFSSNS